MSSFGLLSGHNHFLYNNFEVSRSQVFGLFRLFGQCRRILFYYERCGDAPVRSFYLIVMYVIEKINFIIISGSIVFCV